MDTVMIGGGKYNVLEQCGKEPLIGGKKDPRCGYEPWRHLPTFATAYRKLFPKPALTIPLRLWTVEGVLTMSRISEEKQFSMA